MMNLKSLYFQFIFSVITITSFAQEFTTDIPIFSPPSPTAYSLGIYGDVQIGLFTGAATSSIPLFTYKTKNLELPISLNYNSNGIKVDQLSPNVGLGWNLSIGGVITRIVRGSPDDERNHVLQDYNYVNPNSEASQYFSNLASTTLDTEADLFMYNFPGGTGKFFINDSDQILLVPVKDHIIKPLPGGFEIIDSQGIKYHFLEKESSWSRSSGGGHSMPSVATVNSWYLSMIVHPKGDEIHFDYSDENYNYITGQYQSMTVNYPVFQCIGPGYTIMSNPINHELQIIGKKLVRIYSNNSFDGEVTLQNKQSHPSVNNYSLVTDIDYVNSENLTIESIDLEYLTTSNKRVFLKEVGFYDRNKKYSMEYITPESFPSRLSFSQDNWGYYNGKTNQYLFPNPNTLEIVPHDIVSYYSYGANKDPDPNFAQIGLLQKIHYPTKGFSEFLYEGNTYNTTKEVVEGGSEPAVVEVNTGQGEGFGGVEDIVLIENLHFDQDIPLFTTILYDNYQCDPIRNDPTKVTAVISIVNNNNSSLNTLYQQTAHGQVALGNTIHIRPDNQFPNTYVSLKAGETYTFKIKIDRPCINSTASFTYSQGELKTVQYNKVIGGLRVKAVASSDGGQSQYKRFYYTSKNNIQNDTEHSSGVKGAPSYYLSTQTVWQEICNNFGTAFYTVINSSSLRSTYSANQENSTFYEYITISHGGDNFENGGEEYQFYIYEDISAEILWQERIFSAPYINIGWNNGLQKLHRIFNSDFQDLKKSEFFYTKDDRLEHRNLSYSIRKNFQVTGGQVPPGDIANLDINKYYTYSYWFYLNSLRETEFFYDLDGNNVNSIQSTQYYEYNNPVHKQISSHRIKNSKSELITTINQYPHDLLTNYQNSAKMQDLVLLNQINSPVITQTYLSKSPGTQEKIFEKHHTYDYFGNMLLPKYQYQVLGENTIDLNPLGNDLMLEFNYDPNNGNIINYRGTDGISRAILWGYNSSYPVIEALNLEIHSLTNLVDGILRDLSYSGGINELDQFLNDAKNDSNILLSFNQILRTEAELHYPDAQLISYTFDPIIGLRSKADAAGITTFYEYDEFGRLHFIKDQGGNILKAYKYNYSDGATH